MAQRQQAAAQGSSSASATTGAMKLPTASLPAAREYLSAMRLRMLGSPEGLPAAAAALAPADAFYDPLAVMRLGERLLKESGSGHTGLSIIERSALEEQVAIAALDAGHNDVAKRHIDALLQRFPTSKSIRSLRLRGYAIEATKGDYTAAHELYMKPLESDETNMFLWRRSIARFLSIGERDNAIEALVVYVDHFMQDTEAWLMLAKLYIQDCKFQQAAFCLEELMMLRPGYPFSQIRYADVVASMGRLNVAVKYYSAALQLLPDHVRALIGLRTVTSLLLRPYASASASSTGYSHNAAAVATRNSLDIDPIPEETLRQLHKFAADRLTAIYEAKGKNAAPLTSVLKTWIHQNQH